MDMILIDTSSYRIEQIYKFEFVDTGKISKWKINLQFIHKE